MNATEEMQFVDSPLKVQAVVERVAAVRDATGPDFGIAVDFHGRVHKPMAKVIAHALTPFNLMFIEEPVLPENNEALRDIAHATSTPIATGERMYSRWDYKPLFESGYADIIQPDLSHAGGITEVRKIAALADVYDVQLAPHCPLGPIALASCLQVGFATPNYLIQEQSIGIHYNEGADVLDYVLDVAPLTFVDGYIPLLTAPGLGIEVDEAAVRTADRTGHRWRTPIWRHEDGSFAEW
jgi:galactonate dehydratase